MVATRIGSRIALPGLASAHSHAFQRGLRGRTQRARHRGSFWSWRDLMYRFSAGVDPETIYAISHLAFVEMALAGYTAVGEFHYLHHQEGGQPYSDRLELSDAVIRAALDAGLRITLLRVLYHRAGFGVEALPEQRRFCDPDVETALADVDALSRRFADDERVTTGVAPHSLRACPLEWIEAAADYSRRNGRPLHMHVAEQRREIDECMAEHGRRPVQVLAEAGVLGRAFTAVHATHLDDTEVKALGASGSTVCICRTTERDLGDGLPRSAELLRAGASLCTGIDSHAVTDPFEEARAIELDERSRAEARSCIDPAELLMAATSAGYRALGTSWAGDAVELDAEDPALLGALDELDAGVLFAATPRALRSVTVAGKRIVENGEHPAYPAAKDAYLRALTRLTS